MAFCRFSLGRCPVKCVSTWRGDFVVLVFRAILRYNPSTGPRQGRVHGKEGLSLDHAVEAAAFLYLMNQDTKSLSPTELYQLYTDTVKKISAYAESKESEENGFAYSR